MKNNKQNQLLQILSETEQSIPAAILAGRLGISERTVKNHVSNIFKKVGVADRTQAAVFAIRSHFDM